MSLSMLFMIFENYLSFSLVVWKKSLPLQAEISIEGKVIWHLSPKRRLWCFIRLYRWL